MTVKSTGDFAILQAKAKNVWGFFGNNKNGLRVRSVWTYYRVRCDSGFLDLCLLYLNTHKSDDDAFGKFGRSTTIKRTKWEFCFLILLL